MSDRFGNIPIQSPESSPFAQKPSKENSQPPSRPSRQTQPTARKKSPKKAPSLSKIWALVIALLTILGCYSALGFLGVPYYCTSVLPEHFHDKTALVLEPTSVTFNPFTFRFATGEVRILAGSGATILSLRALQADIAPLAVLHRDLASKTLTIDGLDLNIVRERDGSYNFQPFFGTGKSRKISEIIKPAELPLFFSLNNISITNSKVTFNDKPAGKIHTAEKIKLDLPTFANMSFQTEQYLRPHFSAIVNGSPIELTGQANLGQTDEDQATRLTVDVHDLELPTYADYLPFSLPMTCIKGTANGKIDLLFAPHNKSGDKLSIGFQLHIAGAELIGENESINILLPNARVDGNLQPVSRILQLREVALKEPTVSTFGGRSFLESIEQLGKKNDPAALADLATEKAAPYRLMLDLLLVDDGGVQFFSKKNDPQPASTWKTIQVSIKDYDADAEANPHIHQGSLSISGEKEGTPTSFSWQGKFTSPESLTGNLHLLKIDSQDLQAAIGDARPFAIKDLEGIGNLTGQLIFYTTKESPYRIHYKLVDAEVSIDNFALLDNAQSILRAPVLKLTGLNLANETFDFGSVQLQNGTAQFMYGRLPNIYRDFIAKKYRLQGIDFTGKVLFTGEKKSDQPLTFTEVSLKANDLANGPTPSDNLSVSGNTKDGGIVQAQGSVALTPFSVALRTGFRRLPLQDILPFFTTSTQLADLQGNLSGKGLLSLPTKNFAGELELSDVSGKGPQKTPFSWQKSVFRDVKYTAVPFHFGAASVAVDAAHFSWQITAETNGPMQYFSDIMKNYLPAADDQAAVKTESSLAPVDIGEISFTAGTMDIHDRRLSPDWTLDGVGFAGSITNVRAAAESRFSFAGQMGNSPFTIDGTMAPFANEANGTFHVSLEDFPLASFTQQFAAKTEIDTGKGQLTLALDCAWQEKQYISSGTLVLADVKPDTDSSDIALPLALLTDSNGDVELPFNFSRTAPVGQTALEEELFTSLQRLLVKGSVSPLLLASGDFSDLIGNEFIEFHPGEFMLTDTGRKTLSRYAALLIANPHVGLILSGGVDKQIDGTAMKKNLTAVEQQRVERENEKLFKNWQDQKDLYQKKLEEEQKSGGANEKIVEQNIPAEILTPYKPLRPVPVEIGEAMLLDLAHKRIDIVYQYLTTQHPVQPERIAIVWPDSLADEPESSTNGVVIALAALGQ